jgi:hypothetical protein
MSRPVAETADHRSLLLHREVAKRLRADPRLFARALERVNEWSESGAAHPFYVETWREAFRIGIDEVLAILEDASERGQSLRQVSPFAFVLPARERWRVLRQARAKENP